MHFIFILPWGQVQDKSKITLLLWLSPKVKLFVERFTLRLIHTFVLGKICNFWMDAGVFFERLTTNGTRIAQSTFGHRFYNSTWTISNSSFQHSFICHEASQAFPNSVSSSVLSYHQRKCLLQNNELIQICTQKRE